MSENYHRYRFWFVWWLLLLAAFALRVFRLEAQSIWWDEGISLNLATSSLSDIIADRLNNIHPPLYFFILKGWVALTGVNPFSARYLTALASFVQVAAVYAVGRRWFGVGGKRAAFVAALLVALSPLSIIYGQEIRMYALLPLIYLAVLAMTRESIRDDTEKRLVFWFVFGGVEWIGLHLHYITAFVILYASVWALIAFYRRRRWRRLRAWLATQVVVGIMSLPWLIGLLLNWTAVQAEANAGAFIAAPVPLNFLIYQVGVFHLTGLAGALGQLEIRWLAGIVFALLLLLILVGMWSKPKRRLTGQLFGQWVVPLTSALYVWSVRSFSHPRYVSIFAIGLVLLIAYLGKDEAPGGYFRGRHGRSWLATVTVWSMLICVITISLISLNDWFFNPAVGKDDMRGLAAYLETVTSPDDLILVPDAGWAFHFEYDGDNEIVMPDLIHRDKMWQNVRRWTNEPGIIYTVDPAGGSRDWQEVIPYALERSGALLATSKQFDGLLLRTYQASQPVIAPELKPVSATFEALNLTGVWVEEDAPANTALTIALGWRWQELDNRQYHVVLRLIDTDGWSLAESSTLLIDEDGSPTDRWQPEATMTTYHVLPILPGTPPLSYRLALGVYVLDANGDLLHVELQGENGLPQGLQFTLPETVHLSTPIAQVRNPYQLSPSPPRLPDPITITDGLSLIAVGLNQSQLNLGQSLLVSLEWLATQAPLPDLRPQIRLLQNGAQLASAEDVPAQGRYPTDQWRNGERVLEHRWLVIPPIAEDGTAEIQLVLGEEKVTIGEVKINVGDRLFSAPPVTYPMDVQFGDVARLIGYDLPLRTVTSAESVPLTLYWESVSTGGDIPYTVFTHILAEDGHLIGQHDSPPVNGNRPTTGWVAQEYIIDGHEMLFHQPGYTGQAGIEIGLYDPATGVRVTMPDGSDALYLPITLTVTSSDSN